MTDALDRIAEGGVVAVVRGGAPDTVGDVARALVEGGVTAVEVTADAPGLTELLDAVAGAVGDDAAVGAGTVFDAETARTAMLAGAEFVVSPSTHEDVIRACNRYGTPVLPGAMTPTEAVTAFEAGADAVKVFPASTVGPGHVAALRGPLGQVPLVPTGGVDLDNAADFVAAGATAVGVGSALVDREAVAAGDFDVLTGTARAFREEVARGRERRVEDGR